MGGPLKRAQDVTAEYLLQLEPDRMLAGYRIRAGLKLKAEGYGGWDAVDRRWGLDLSYKFEPLKRHQDILEGKHANTQVPKLIGSADRYACAVPHAFLMSSMPSMRI